MMIHQKILVFFLKTVNVIKGSEFNKTIIGVIHYVSVY